MNNFNFNSYPYNQLQTGYQSQRIQTLSSSMSTDAQVFYVTNPQDMERINPQANVIYIGLNPSKKEIYIRQTNGMGLIDLDTYVRQSGEQSKNELTQILEKLNEITKGKDNVIQSANDTSRNVNADKRNVKKSPDYATIQSDNER